MDAPTYSAGQAFSPDILSRYSRQTAFAGLGIEGQKKLLRSRAVVIGVGALGTFITERLCRAGLGFIRLIDRDIVDMVNLHRQTLFTEDDALQKKPKAMAAAGHLAAINSTVTLEPIIANVDDSNIEAFVSGADIVLDGSDNLELRFLINETCHKNRVPWVYGGAIAASGACMSIIPDGPCFRCLCPLPEPDSQPNFNTDGIVNMIPAIVACLEVTEAVKILTCPDSLSKKYIAIDLWKNSIEYITILKNPRCPVCGRN